MKIRIVDDDWTVGDTDILFLGAGFSRAATDGAAPLMSDFFHALDSRKHWTLSKFLDESFGTFRQANVEEALLKLDQLCASPLVGVDSFFDQCRKRHAEVRKELDLYILERLNNLKIHDGNWAASLLFGASDRTTVITTNYDNLAEAILSHQERRHRTADTNCHHCKMCRILEVDCGCGSAEWGTENPTWRGSLLKLHGSIAWRRCINPECNPRTCLIPDVHCRPFKNEPCDCCGGACSPVLVPPSMVKTFDSFGQIKRMWNGAYQALLSAESLVIFGFSLPRSDAIIAEMLASTIGRTGKLARLAIIDRDPSGPLKRVEEIMARADGELRVTLHEAPPSGMDPEWLHRFEAAAEVQP